MTKYSTICLIVAAGSGERLKNAIPKQYLPLAGAPVLRHSVLKFLNHPQIDAVKVVYNPGHQKYYDLAIAGLPVLAPVKGGKTRQESVLAGLESLEQYEPKIVLIHDAARPMISSDIITDIIQKLDEENGVIPAIAVPDTIKKCENNKIIATIPRENLFYAQTPQGFIYNEILDAHRKTKHLNLTDDAAVFEHLQKTVSIIKGSKDNFKITTREDLEKAEALL